MKQGVVLFAFNNNTIDYIKQAVYCAKRIKKYLKLSVQLITDDEDYLIKSFPFYKKYIDVVTYSTAPIPSSKVFYDGIHGNHGKLDWKNSARDSAFDLTVFEQTLVIDTDLLISNDKLLTCFSMSEDFMIAKSYQLVNTSKSYKSFDRISDSSIPMYWATILYFTKSYTSKTVFDLVTHIKENYNYYRLVYSITEKKFRNDFAFSIAVHILNGHAKGDIVGKMPSKLYYTIDKDILHKINNDELTFIIDNNPIKTKQMTVHAMNKYSLEELL